MGLTDVDQLPPLSYQVVSAPKAADIVILSTETHFNKLIRTGQDFANVEQRRVMNEKRQNKAATVNAKKRGRLYEPKTIPVQRQFEVRLIRKAVPAPATPNRAAHKQNQAVQAHGLARDQCVSIPDPTGHGVKHRPLSDSDIQLWASLIVSNIFNNGCDLRFLRKIVRLEEVQN
ncbi:hypothetical protein BDV93DRAFT_524331 [Ceratobasidium sp. AG-I]|nr:hypothetical protein BDV93DRAFT_524331 [Ceratobasidium sp. AG-I]